MRFVSGHSIFWRLKEESGEGADAVSVVLTNYQNQDLAEVAVDREAASITPGASADPETIDIEWNKRDLDLFLTLLHNNFSEPGTPEEAQQLEFDLTDESVVHILQIVAAARFARPHPAEPVVNPHPLFMSGSHRADVGEQISIDTIAGLKPAVVVADTEQELHCVLLDEISSPSGDDIRFGRHDMVVLKKELALPGSFTSLQPSDNELIH